MEIVGLTKLWQTPSATSTSSSARPSRSSSASWPLRLSNSSSSSRTSLPPSLLAVSSTTSRHLSAPAVISSAPPLHHLAAHQYTQRRTFLAASSVHPTSLTQPPRLLSSPFLSPSRSARPLAQISPQHPSFSPPPTLLLLFRSTFISLFLLPVGPSFFNLLDITSTSPSARTSFNGSSRSLSGAHSLSEKNHQP